MSKASVPRVLSWRLRALQGLIARFTRGELSLPDYEAAVEERVQLNEAQALSVVAKEAAQEADVARQAAADAARAAKRQQQLAVLRALLQQRLGVDSTPYETATAEVFCETWGVWIDGVCYWRVERYQDGDGRWQGPCLYAGKFCPYGAGTHSLISRRYDITDLVTLGEELRWLEIQRSCSSWECNLRAGGLNDVGVEAARAEAAKRVLQTSGSTAYMGVSHLVPVQTPSGLVWVARRLGATAILLENWQ